MLVLNRKERYKSNGSILMIPPDEIQQSPHQPRRHFCYESLLELAQSISENGLIHPITVDLQGKRPVLVAGERRLRAAKIAGLREIPCIEVQAGGSRSMLLALIENLQREDMNCFEMAEGVQRLIEIYNLTQEEAAHQLGFSQSTIANRLRLLKISNKQRQILIEAGLTERHARALLRLDDEHQREVALCRMVQNKLNVAQSDQMIENCLEQQQPKQKKRKKSMPIVRDMRLFFNTISNAVDTMRRSGIEASAQKTETEEYIEYLVRIPKAVEALKPEQSCTA